MRKVVILFLFSFLFSWEASAQLLDRDSRRQLFMDFPDTRTSRYCEGDQYSRFPKPEPKLRACLPAHRDPLDVIYARDQALMYTVRPNDTLKKIARNHGTTIELIKALNRMQGDHLKVGRKLWIWDKPFTLEIDKTLNRLYLKAGDVLLKVYPVSTGKSVTQTPLGIFFVESRYPFPTWFHKGTVVPGGSPNNYLGTRWLGFDKPQFGIHGTIFPELIGQSVSKGCIRMRNEDVEELYEFIPVGTTVIITEE